MTTMTASIGYRLQCLCLGASLVLLLAISSAAAAQSFAQPSQKVLRAPTTDKITEAKPGSPNPYLSFLPYGVAPDWEYWRARMKRESKTRMQNRLAIVEQGAEGPVVVDETEPNNTSEMATLVSNFGTGENQVASLQLSGDVASPQNPTEFVPGAEDEGSIPLASSTGLRSGTAIVVQGAIGNGPHGSAGSGRGDFDFYKVVGVLKGQVIIVDVDGTAPVEPLDPVVAIYSSDGQLLAANDDDGDVGSFDSLLFFTAPADGDYFVSIGGFGSFIPTDPFDSGSGLGAVSEGAYRLTMRLDSADADFFHVQLEAGDILGLSAPMPVGNVALFAPDGEELVSSSQDASGIYPSASPLPGGGRGVLTYVIDMAGAYTLRLIGVEDGAYQAEMGVFKPPAYQSVASFVQKLFLDFDGAVVNPAIFGGPLAQAPLSPLSVFLPGWGLNANDESAVIDVIVNVVRENLSEDIRMRGSNGDSDVTGTPGAFDIEILNSRDHADPFGQPNVSRIVIGGTIDELGLETIGIAQSIDPGNFDTAETAVVLLDLLSAPEFDPNSLNAIPLAEGADIIDLIGTAVGNIVAHEAGHFFGGFHTDQFNPEPNIMDQGGNLANTIGLGADGVFGSADDDNVAFDRDQYVINEGFQGVEDTLNVIAFGLPGFEL